MTVLLGLILPPPSFAQDIGMEVPPGLDLDGIMLPVGNDGDTTGPLSPVDEAFDKALAAYRTGDQAEARATWTELSDAGHGLSTHNLAVMVWRGAGGERDPARALALFQEAADMETPPSLHALGVLRLHGIGVESDPEEAIRLFEVASGLGHTVSTYNLAIAHLQGIGGVNDPEAGVVLLEAAAEADLDRAQYDLAGLLYEGRLVPQDHAAARTWFERAAAMGDPFALYNLGLMQLSGEGGPVDRDGGVADIADAAAAGVVPAQVRLAHYLATKSGASTDDKRRALTWFLVAASFNAENAAENAVRLKAALTPNAVAEAEARAATFRPTPIVRPAP